MVKRGNKRITLSIDKEYKEKLLIISSELGCYNNQKVIYFLLDFYLKNKEKSR